MPKSNEFIDSLEEYLEDYRDVLNSGISLTTKGFFDEIIPITFCEFLNTFAKLDSDIVNMTKKEILKLFKTQMSHSISIDDDLYMIILHDNSYTIVNRQNKARIIQIDIFNRNLNIPLMQEIDTLTHQKIVTNKKLKRLAVNHELLQAGLTNPRFFYEKGYVKLFYKFSMHPFKRIRERKKINKQYFKQKVQLEDLIDNVDEKLKKINLNHHDDLNLIEKFKISFKGIKHLSINERRAEDESKITN